MLNDPQLFSLVSGLSQEAIIVTDVAGRIQFVNAAFENMTHFTQAEVLGQTPRILKSDHHPPAFYADLWQALCAGRVVQRQFINRKKNGELYCLQETIRPLTDGAGQTVGFVSVGQDVTQHKQDLLQMQKFVLAIEQTGDHVLITDKKGIIEYVNPAFERLTGYTRAELVGHTTPRILRSGQHDRNFYKQMWQTILAGATYRGITVNRRRDGTFYYEEKTISPLRDESGQIKYFVSVGRDISDRVQAEKEILETRTQLARLNRTLASYTQPAILKFLESGVDPLLLPPYLVEHVVLFSDIVAFSVFSEKLAPADIMDIANTFLAVCSNIITPYGGEVSKVIGDSVMAYFPAEAADHALQAAVEILAKLAQLRAAADPGDPLSVLYAGIGLAIGPVVKGNVGSNTKMDYTILGDVVNIAARLESLTRQMPYPLCLTDEFQLRVHPHWNLISLGPHVLKGKDLRVGVYSLANLRVPTHPNYEAHVYHNLQSFLAHRANGQASC